MLKALPGFALIELPTKYESGLTTEKEKYASRSEGKLINGTYAKGMNNTLSADEVANSYGKAEGRTVYFAPYEDGEPIKYENKEYVFVPITSLRGVKDAEA